MAYGTVSADVIQSSVANTSLGAGNASIMKNRCINGDMRIDQRNAGASVTATGSNFSLDRWQMIVTASSKFTVQQNAGSVTPPTGFTNYLGATSSAATSLGATDYYVITQKIEGFNTADLGWGTANAKTVTVSFWVRSSLTGTFGFVLRNGAGNRVYPASYTISAANTWEQKSVTIAGDTTGTWSTDNSIGVELDFCLGVGSTYSNTAGTWTTGGIGVTGATSVVGTNGATFYITACQLEVGSSATGYEYENYTSLLQKCQRYFVKDLQDGAAATFLIGVIDASTTSNRCGMRFPVTMRTTPTAAVGGTANPRIYDGNAAPVITSIIGNSSSSFGACIAFSASGGGLTIGRAATIIDNSASFITYSAEL
jgi:hypothetical protein